MIKRIIKLKKARKVNLNIEKMMIIIEKVNLKIKQNKK